MERIQNMKLRLFRFFWRKAVLINSRLIRAIVVILLPREEKNFLKFIFQEPKVDSRSQLYQDLLPGFYLGGEDSFYVEVGVGNGVQNSNTFILEKNLGWKGILVEPNTTFHISIAGNRSGILVKWAAGSENYSRVSLVHTSDGELSYIPNDFVSMGGRRRSAISQVVETRTLDTILNESKAPTVIDFLSIDVEGFELEVLYGIDFKKYSFQVVCVEHNYNQEKCKKIHEILSTFGYVRVLKIASQFDSFYINSNIVKPAKI
jgi:FkbM family methyltransferase